MEPPLIVASRIIARPLVAADASNLYAAVDESRLELGEWLDWCRSGYTATDAAGWIETVSSPEIWKNSRSFGFFHVNSGERVLGSVGLSQIDWSTATANLGYWIRTSELRKGLAREAAAAMAEYGRTHLGLARIEIAVHPLNVASARVARALGARDEGLVPARIMFRGTMTEAHLFSL
jgi:ribosomal-protein-serine acetyltransferase